MKQTRVLSLFVLLLILSACGGGGSADNSAPGTDNPAPVSWTKGVFKPASQFAQRCKSPRSGINPETNRPFQDTQGTVLDENNFLRSWSNDFYLWYREIEDRDPATFTSPQEYFKTLKTFATTTSGKAKDRFHFIMSTEDAFKQLNLGQSSGYGMHLSFLSFAVPREILVSYVEPGSPADSAGIRRGTRLLSVDGIDLVNSNDNNQLDRVVSALFPESLGETHRFNVENFSATEKRTISLASANIETQPIRNAKVLETENGKLGYVQFNSHVLPAINPMIAAFKQFKQQGVTDLVLDIRYNGGGILDIANGLSFMVAGQQATQGKIFERVQFNDKHPDINPFTQRAIDKGEFITGVSPSEPLPALNLSRVFVLTTASTCSASEAIINGLRGIDVEVIQIGSSTCGKPYGFYHTDNCGTTYFSINFKGVNNKGFGDYADGFTPANSVAAEGVITPGCAVADDFSHKLGDPAESLLATALTYRVNGICPAATAFHARAKGLTQHDQSLQIKIEQKQMLLNNRILP